MDEQNQLPEELQKALKDIIKLYDDEQRTARERELRDLKRADNFWHGIQYAIWDDSVGDFRSPANIFESQIEQDVNPNIFSKIKNIYKAHGESTIAALTTGIPYVRYFPNNAENADDIQTAKAYSKIEELIQRHNKAQLLFIHSLFILFNQSFVAAYNYTHSDKKYGQTKVPVMGQQQVMQTTQTCPECGAPMGEEMQEGEILEGPELIRPEAGPESLNVEESADPNLAANPPVDGEYPGAQPEMPMPPMPALQTCPGCGSQVEPYIEQMPNDVPAIIRYEDIDKTRECVEVYGPLHVSIPHHVREQKEIPVLGLDGEIHHSMALEYWPHLVDKITQNADTSQYDVWGRTPSTYAGDSPRGLVTVRRRWLRSWSFNALAKNQGDIVKELKAKFPSGCYCVLVNDEFAEACEEDMDDHWTVTKSPLSNYLHADPLGAGLLPLQEVTNELLNLNLQSIQYGIPETFADPEVLDFNQYQKVESGPGLMFPAKPGAGGKSISDSFFTNKVAVLSKEAMEFGESINQDAQFVSGSFPSIYGGPQSGGGETAAQYSMSRAQALQRLGLTWKILSNWWAEVMGKAVASYANNMVEDEAVVKRVGDSYINVWIRKVELEGKIGTVEPDVDEQFPISWAQKREVFLDLVKLQSEELNQFLFSPANRIQAASLVGLRDFEVPGEKDINKQLAEIMEMLQGEAVMPPMDEMGQPMMDEETGEPMMGQSSVPIDPELDDHEVHADTCKSWMNDDVGRELKKKAPQIYMNIFLHFKEHVTKLQEQAAQQMEQEKEMAEFQSNLKSNEKGGEFNE